ncbi:MAG: hypothetical protein EWM51_03595 [Treponema sp.]|nr:MAG: hypothetical protein EWM51_03595 [Treponema sp.]
MIIKTENMETTEYPETETLARLYKVFDLGYQPGIEGPQHEIALLFELDALTPDKKPMTITKRFTASMHPKANLRKFIEAWRGSPFNDDEVKIFDTDTLEGQYAFLTFTKKKSNKTGKVWTDIFQIRRKPREVPPFQKRLQPGFVPDWIKQAIEKQIQNPGQTQCAGSAPEYDDIPAF